MPTAPRPRRLSASQTREIFSFSVGVIRDEIPAEYEDDLVISNYSGTNKVILKAMLWTSCLVYLHTVGDSIVIYAGVSEYPLHEPNGQIRYAGIEHAIRATIKQRLPGAIDLLVLNRPLRSVQGASVRRERAGGITLTLEGLSDKAYLRVLGVLEPLLTTTRFQRDLQINGTD